MTGDAAAPEPSVPGTDVAAADALPGDRVVVRYRLGSQTPTDWRAAPNPRPSDTGFALSDVTGLLVDAGDPLRLSREGTIESIPRAQITSIRLLSARPVRNSEIRALEHAAALAWPGVEHTWLGGWLLRAGHTISRRANSAIPLDRSPATDAHTLAAIESWYQERGLPPLLAMPERLLPRQVSGSPASPDIHILTRDLASGAPTRGAATPAVDLGDAEPQLTAAPSDGWLRAYLGADVDLGAAQAVCSAHVGGAVTFASIESAGDLIAIGRGALTESPEGHRWLGLTALWTSPDHRRHHHGDAVVATLLDWGVAAGAHRACVQVEAGNRIAGAWYRSRGFALHHRSRYLHPTGGDR